MNDCSRFGSPENPSKAGKDTRSVCERRCKLDRAYIGPIYMKEMCIAMSTVR